MDITESTTPQPPGDDWLFPADPAYDGAVSAGGGGPAATSRSRQWLTSGGLLAAGVFAGVVVVLAAGHGGSSPSATPFTPAASVPGGAQPGLPPAGAFPRGDDGAEGSDDRGGQFPGAPGGGLAGEQRLQGTLTRVGGSTITVRTSAGTSTYTVTDATQIVRNGAVVGLGSLKAGDPVLVHLYPSGAGGRLLAERIFAGTSSGFTT